MTELRVFKFVTSLVLEFYNDDGIKFTTFYSTLKAKTVINENDIDDIFETIYVKDTKISWKMFWLGY